MRGVDELLQDWFDFVFGRECEDDVVQGLECGVLCCHGFEFM